MIKTHESAGAWWAFSACEARLGAEVPDDRDEHSLVLETQAARLARWTRQAGQAGQRLDYVTVGDQPAVDGMAELCLLFGCVPPRLAFTPESPLIARSRALLHGPLALQRAHCAASGVSYLQPEFDSQTRFELQAESLLAEVDQALALPASPKVALLGPVSLLFMGRSVEEGFERLSLLDRLLQVYELLLIRLAARGVTWIQLDEPITGHELPADWRDALRRAYARLHGVDPQLILSTAIRPLPANLGLLGDLPVAGLHLAGGLAAEELRAVARALPVEREFSVELGGDGLGPDSALSLLRELRRLRGGRLWMATRSPLSCHDGAFAPAGILDAIKRQLWQDDATMARALRAAAPSPVRSATPSSPPWAGNAPAPASRAAQAHAQV